MSENRRQEYDSTVEYLQRARLLDLRIDADFESIQQLRALAERRTRAYGPARASAAPRPDGRMDVVARIVDAERELDERIDRLLTLKREIGATIERVPDERMRALLKLRYLNGLTWEEVAERMHYTTRNVYNLHAAALRLAAPLVREARCGAQSRTA